MPTSSAQSYPENHENDQLKTKVCSRKDCPFAGSQQPLDDFYLRKHKGPNARHSWCKKCLKIVREIPPKNPRIIPAPDGMKVCTGRTCCHNKEPQPMRNFGVCARNSDGLNKKCKDCEKDARERSRKKIMEKFPSASDVYVEGKTKICSRRGCKHDGIELPLTKFYRSNSSSNGLCGYCKDCCDILTVKYEENNKEKVKATLAAYVEKNKEKIKARERNYRLTVLNPYRTEHWEEEKVKKIRIRAKKKNFPFNLEPSDLLPLPKFCPMFGILLDYSGGPDKRSRASVDRIKPELGYVKGNVRIISTSANYAKLDGDDSIFDAIRLHHSV